MNRLLFLSICLITTITASAQQDPTYTQYTFNPFAFNPAYAGIHDMTQVSSIVRRQNMGLAGAPMTMSFNGHTSLPFNNAGIGINLVHESQGIQDDFQANISLAYRIKSIGGDKALSFGIQGGIFNHRFDQSLLNPADQNDPNFQGVQGNITKPIIGAGLFYSTDKYYVGFSAPRLLSVDFDVLDLGTDTALVRYTSHYYLTGGVLLDPDWGESIKLKPSFLLRFLDNAPSSLDLGASLLFNDMVWAGASFRASLSDIVPSSFNIYGQLQITDALKAGIAYDFPTNLNLARYPTIEIMANVNFAAFGFQSVKVVYY